MISLAPKLSPERRDKKTERVRNRNNLNKKE
jgi:hypothetical protein